MARQDDNLDIIVDLLESLVKEKKDEGDEHIFNFIYALAHYLGNTEQYSSQLEFFKTLKVEVDRVPFSDANLFQVLDDIINLLFFIKKLPEGVQTRLAEIYNATSIQTKELVPFYIASRVNYIWFVYYTLGHQERFRKMLNVGMFIDIPGPIPDENAVIGFFYPLGEDIYQFFASLTTTLVGRAAWRNGKKIAYKDALSDDVVSGIRAGTGDSDELIEGEMVRAVETEEILEGDPNLDQPDVIVIHPKVVERGESGIFRKLGYKRMMDRNKVTTEEEKRKMIEEVVRKYQRMKEEERKRQLMKERQSRMEEERRIREEKRGKVRFEYMREEVKNRKNRKKIEESKPKFNTIRGTKEIEEEIQKISNENENLISKRPYGTAKESAAAEKQILLNGFILSRLREEMKESSDIERILGLFGEAEQRVAAEDHDVKKKKEVDAAPQGDFVDFVTEKNIEEREKRMEEVANNIEQPEVVTGKAMEEDAVEEITTIDLTSLPSTPVTSQDIQMQFEEPIKKEPGTE